MLIKLFKITSLLAISGILFFLIQKRDFHIFVQQKIQHATTTAPDDRERGSDEVSPVVSLPPQEQQPVVIEPVAAPETVDVGKQPMAPTIAPKVASVYEDMHEGTSDTDPSYRPSVSPCTKAMGFKIGTFDSRFGITKDFFIQELTQSASVWGDAVDKKLFYHDPNGSLTINLVYDKRQETTINVSNLALEIENSKRNADGLRAIYEAEKIIYSKDYEQLTKDIENFQLRQKAYGTKVETYNASGGATKIEYEAMTNELNQLKQEAINLEERKQAVNAFAEAINKKVTRYNEFVRYTNSLIRQSNALGASQFTEGKFTPYTNTIDIYQYNDSIKLRRVLIHELGHVLGINHNENVYSIMYSFNSATTTSLSKDDIAALRDVCPF